jgi:PAS domain S-box-containing protein
MAKVAEQALRDSEKRYRDIVETASEGICLLDSNLCITFVNRRFATMLRDTPEHLLGRSVVELLFRADHTTSPEKVPNEFFLGRVAERRVRREDGTFFWAAVSFTTMFDASSNMAGFLLMFTDISDRKELEATREKLVLRLVSAQEDERRRLSRELHDQVGQHVTGLLLGLNRLEQIGTDSSESAELIRKLRQLAKDISRDAHHLALELRPAALDDLGLAVAVSNYADDVARRAALDVDVHCDLNVRLDPAIETTVYRVIQEALTNVVKHASAKRVSVILDRQDGAVRAIVEDDGVGFRPDRLIARDTPDARLGLIGMRERAALVGGELQIESRPGGGTTLFVRVPMKPEGRGGHEEIAIAAGR